MTYTELREELAASKATLVAVSKTQPLSKIQALYDEGQRHFGENRVQELVEKNQALPDDIIWHMIGNLQKNKVKKIAPFISLIHSVDSLSLAQVIHEQAMKNDRVIDVLIQVSIAQEDTKSGYPVKALMSEVDVLLGLDHIRIRGLMGMATFTAESAVVRKEFQLVKTTFDHLKKEKLGGIESFDTISMGMSGDYQIAIVEGSTMVRIGSMLFGAR